MEGPSEEGAWIGSMFPIGHQPKQAWTGGYGEASGWSSCNSAASQHMYDDVPLLSQGFGSFSGGGIWTNHNAKQVQHAKMLHHGLPALRYASRNAPETAFPAFSNIANTRFLRLPPGLYSAPYVIFPPCCSPPSPQNEAGPWSGAGAASMWSPSPAASSEFGGLSLFYTPKAFRLEENHAEGALSAASTHAGASGARGVHDASDLLSSLSLFPGNPSYPPLCNFEHQSSPGRFTDCPSSPPTTSPPTSLGGGRRWGVHPERLTFDDVSSGRAPASSSATSR